MNEPIQKQHKPKLVFWGLRIDINHQSLLHRDMISSPVSFVNHYQIQHRFGRLFIHKNRYLAAVTPPRGCHTLTAEGEIGERGRQRVVMSDSLATWASEHFTSNMWECVGIPIPVSAVPGLVHVSRAIEHLVGLSLTMLLNSGEHARPSKNEFVKFETSSRMLLFYS